MAPAPRSPGPKRPSSASRGARSATPRPTLKVAITGPTGEIGKSVLRALDRANEVKSVVGMARRPFDPAAMGLKKVSYVQGDVLDRASVDALAADADVLIHLAFLIMGGLDESREVNLQGSENVFRAAVDAGVKRLVYASSVAAYGFHADNPDVLTEDVPARGTDEHYYSAQKAEVEKLLATVLDGSTTEAYVFRPCIVAGPDAPLLVANMPYIQIGERLPGAVRRLFDVVPVLRPVLPDNGVPFQLVHHDDVASAFAAATVGRGEPGIYNLAGPGELTMSDLARELGWYSVPIPELLVDATAEIVARLPFLPAEAGWIEAVRTPVLMDCSKARRLLRWRPRHDAAETLRQLVAEARSELDGGA